MMSLILQLRVLEDRFVDWCINASVISLLRIVFFEAEQILLEVNLFILFITVTTTVTD